MGAEVAFWGAEASDAALSHPPERLGLWRLDGSREWSAEVPGADAPAIGDADGDGEPELCISGYGGALYLFEADGTVRWSLPSRGDSLVPEEWGAAAEAHPQCVLADLDADSAYEVVFFDQQGLRILDGRTGAVLTERSDYVLPGGRRWISPSVADLDGDGSADIVVSAYASEDQVRSPEVHLVAFRSASGSFARTRQVWNEYGYDATALDESGRLISWPVPVWDAYGTYRAQPSFDGVHPDLVPVLGEVCTSETACDGSGTGTVELVVQVENRGTRDQPAGAVVRLHTAALLGCFEEVGKAEMGPIAAGWISEGVALEVPRSAWGVRQVLEVTYDEAGWTDPDRDCDLVNNRLPLEVELCAE